jgi:hypothetical protein
MVTVKDLGDKVELAVLLPVADKQLGNGISKDGFSMKDLRSYGFNITLKMDNYVEFVQDVMNEFSRLQMARAEIFKNELDASGVH